MSARDMSARDVVQDDGSYDFSANLSFADQQERAIHAPFAAFTDSLISRGFDAKTAYDLCNKDLAGYMFYTQYPRPMLRQSFAGKYIPAFYGGTGISQWSIPHPTLYIDPLTGQISPNMPQEFNTSLYAGGWEFEVGSGAVCMLIITPNWANAVNQGLIAKLDATETWVKRHVVFTPGYSGTLSLRSTAKWTGYAAAASIINQAVAVIFNLYGDAGATLLGITPVNPNMPATINPQDYSAVPYSGNAADFPAYRKQVATEWVDRQYACAFLGPEMVKSAVTSGQLFLFYDIISPSPVDPAMKALLMTGDYAHPMGHVPTIPQTLIGRMCKGDRPFALKADNPNVQTQTGQDYKGQPHVESDVGVDPEFVKRVYKEYSARMGCYFALDRNHMVIGSVDEDGQGMGSRFGAVLKPWIEESSKEPTYPQITGPNPDWNLRNALNSALVTKGQIQRLARDGLFESDPALRQLLIDKPSQDAYNTFTQFPNAQDLLDAYLGKL